jgi:uncharacterized protein YerC
VESFFCHERKFTISVLEVQFEETEAPLTTLIHINIVYVVTQISKYKLKKEVETRIYDLLSGVLAEIKNKDEVNGFLEDFFSPTEKTVMAKRLAIAVLIAKGNDYQQIRQILKVTPVTISKMSLRMKYGNGSVKKVADRIANSDDNKALLEELLSVFDVPTKGLPISEYHRKIKRRSQTIKRFEKEL